MDELAAGGACVVVAAMMDADFVLSCVVADLAELGDAV